MPLISLERLSTEGFAGVLAGFDLRCEAEAARAESDELGPLKGTIYRVTRKG